MIPSYSLSLFPLKNSRKFADSPPRRLALIRPHFDQILADPHWLPAEFRQPQTDGGMGSGVANWLLYRDPEGGLVLMALVLPPGATTPVHDHLAWGMIGLYQGEQAEEVFQPAAPVGPDDQHADLKLIKTNHLQAGSYYELIPPYGDIHRVVTTSQAPSISLHLLTKDVGCILRHRFSPETGEVYSFLSRYSNRDCPA